MFSRKTEPAVTPIRAAKRGGSFSVIGADVVVIGDIATSENLQVNGRIEGDVSCAVLHQGASGAVSGNIVADEARIAGLVEGRVSAGLLILEPSARLTGDVSYETLSVEVGAQVDGQLAHRRGQEGAKAALDTLSGYFPASVSEAAE